MGPELSRAPISLGLYFFVLKTFFSFFFFACRFFPPGADAGFTKRGGGGAAPSIGPRALETLATPLPDVPPTAGTCPQGVGGRTPNLLTSRSRFAHAPSLFSCVNVQKRGLCMQRRISSVWNFFSVAYTRS